MNLYDRVIVAVLHEMFWFARHAPNELWLYQRVLEDLITFGED